MSSAINTPYPCSFLALALLATLGAYWPGVGDLLIFDDFAALAPLLAADSPAGGAAQLISSTGPLGRPVSMLSFHANAALSGDNVSAWKFTNVALHCLIGVLLFLVAARIFALARVTAKHAEVCAAIGAMLWLLHPLHVSTVLYLVQRMTQLSALFTALGVLLYLIARTRVQANRTTRALLWSSCLVCLPLAALSKENGVLLPLYLALLEFTLLRDTGPIEIRREVRVLLATFVVLPALAAGVYLALRFDEAIVRAYAARPFTLAERLLTESRVVAQYLVQIVAPARGNLGFFHDDIAVSAGLFTPPATGAAILGLVLFTSGAVALRKRAPLVSYGILSFLAGHVLESTIFSLELMFEHRNYLPSFGIIVAAIGTLMSFAHALRPLAIKAIVTIMLMLYALVTYSIARDWRSEFDFYRAAFEVHPRSPAATAEFAQILTRHSRYSEALAALSQAPGAGAATQRWYIECLRSRVLTDELLSETAFANEKALSVQALTGLMELSKLRLDRHCEFSNEAFLRVLDHAQTMPIILPSNRHKLTLYAAQIAWQNGQQDEAIMRLERLSQLTPDVPLALLLMSQWLHDSGKIAEGADALRRAERIVAQAEGDYAQDIAALRARYKLPAQ